MREPFGAHMRPVSCRKRVVDVKIPIGGDRFRQFGIIRLLAWPEAGIFQQRNIAITQNANRLCHNIASNFWHKHDFTS